jgi:hypothetical protein
MHAPTPTQFGSSSRNVHSYSTPRTLARGCGFALARYVRHGRIPAGLTNERRMTTTFGLSRRHVYAANSVSSSLCGARRSFTAVAFQPGRR